jgi:hypothetical protein
MVSPTLNNHFSSGLICNIESDISNSGSHHACSTFDDVAKRGGVPWGACLNSSITQTNANCRIIWCAQSFVLASLGFHTFFMHPSPHLMKDPGWLNDNHCQGFIETTEDVVVGDELLWKYNISQSYRDFAAPGTPAPAPDKRVRDKVRCEGCQCINPCSSVKYCLTPQADLAKRIVSFPLPQTLLRCSAVPHSCQHHTSCVPGKCENCACAACKLNQATGKRIKKIPQNDY